MTATKLTTCLKPTAGLFAVFLAGLIGATYLGKEFTIRREAHGFATPEASNDRYHVECFAGLGRDESSLVLRVFERHTQSLGEYRRNFFYGTFTPHWVCNGGQCTEFRWSARDGDGIELPADLTARLRGHLHWGGAAAVSP